MRNSFLLTLVFWSGFVTLGSELAASRLLAPFFGTSTLVWAALIGLILIYLAVGYWLGGRWADRSPRATTLLGITTWAAFFLGVVPFVATPVLRLALRGFSELSGGLLAGSFAGVLVLFSVPLVLLGGVSPFAIRLSMVDLDRAGQIAGRLYAVSTLGSFLGTLVPVLWLIPVYGTRATFLVFSLSLLALSGAGFVLEHAAPRALLPLGLGALIGVAGLVGAAGRTILKPGPGVLFEGESAYHYIRVRTAPNGFRLLELNEGQGIHSAYRPGEQLTGSVWDFYLLAPLFNPSGGGAASGSAGARRRWAIIGLAAGSTARSIQAVYGDDPVDGVEIDPEILAVGRRFFDMDQLRHLHTIVADGRTWLTLTPTRYDVIAVDAYRQPYIPFHLTTVEFFRLARDHLTPRGVVAINVGRTPNDWRLVNALSATMRQVFPGVFVLDVDDSYNSLVIGTNQPVTLPEVRANLAALADPTLASLARRTQGHLGEAPRQGPIFTDDRAPVEQVVDLMIIDYARSGAVEEER
ncbi:MAG: fused MFS/spermidine synthase [Ardenticatenaceae bacterium]|nr:fused MFS/spermidine synthase [Ardenticatenaceae bacterium]